MASVERLQTHIHIHNTDVNSIEFKNLSYYNLYTSGTLTISYSNSRKLTDHR